MEIIILLLSLAGFGLLKNRDKLKAAEIERQSKGYFIVDKDGRKTEINQKTYEELKRTGNFGEEPVDVRKYVNERARKWQETAMDAEIETELRDFIYNSSPDEKFEQISDIFEKLPVLKEDVKCLKSNPDTQALYYLALLDKCVTPGFEIGDVILDYMLAKRGKVRVQKEWHGYFAHGREEIPSAGSNLEYFPKDKWDGIYQFMALLERTLRRYSVNATAVFITAETTDFPPVASCYGMEEVGAFRYKAGYYRWLPMCEMFNDNKGRFSIFKARQL